MGYQPTNLQNTRDDGPSGTPGGRENELESHAHVVESAWIGLEQNVLTVALALTLFRTSFAALIPVPVRKDLDHAREIVTPIRRKTGNGTVRSHSGVRGKWDPLLHDHAIHEAHGNYLVLRRRWRVGARRRCGAVDG